MDEMFKLIRSFMHKILNLFLVFVVFVASQIASNCKSCKAGSKHILLKAMLPNQFAKGQNFRLYPGFKPS